MKWYNKTVVAVALLVFMATTVVNLGLVSAASPGGYLTMPDQINPGGSGIKSGTFGTFALPGKGDVTIHYEDIQALSHMQHFTEALSADYLALGYNPGGPDIPVVYQQDGAAADGTVTYVFERAWRDLAFAIFDVDQDDIVTIAALDEDGNMITDFSGWTVLSAGDAIISNPSGGTKPAPEPSWNPAVGQLSSVSAGMNTSRTFFVLQPDVAVSQISYHLAAPGSGAHIYTTIWSNATPELSIGNDIWHDANNNGVLDSGETRLAGVLVELLDGSGTMLDTAITDGNGHYEFDDLPEGRYQVRVAGANFTPGGVLEGYRSSLHGVEPASADNARTNHIDVGTEGANLLVNGVTSGFFDLFYDAGPVTDGDDLRWTYFSADFGFVSVAGSATTGNGGNGTDGLAKTGISLAAFVVASGVIAAVSLAIIRKPTLT